jgi:hypothetical protein
VSAMRKTALLTLLVATLVPAAAWAAAGLVGDGTLSVRNGDGLVRLELDRGVAIGRVGSGTIELIEPAELDCATLRVWDDGELAVPFERLLPIDGEERFACVFRGANMRFRLAAGDGDVIRLQGRNIGLSAVGVGSGFIRGRKESRLDGTWALNGEDYVSLPDERQAFKLAAPALPE